MKCFKCVPQFAKKMDIFRTFILLNLFLQFSEGFSWLSSSVNSSSCEGKNINITWEYNLDTSESADTAQWRKDNGVGGTISVATFFSGTFYEASNYIGRLNRIGNAGLEIKNARYMDSGIYYYFVTLNTGITNSSNATVSVYVIPNTSCMPVTEKSNRNIFTCKIHDACPGRNSIQARWDDGSVGVLTCLSATKHKCCAEGTSVTNCYNGSLCTEIECEDALCHPDGPLFIIHDICIIISYIIVVILIIDLIFWIKNLTFPVFKPFAKRGHRCLCILYLVLLIIVVVCEIGIIIMISICRQYQVILGVGLGLGLFIIIVTCIFLIVFIKTEIIIHHKDTILNPRPGTDVKITASVHHIFISDVEWIGPKGNVLTTGGKYIIAQYCSDTGETSLTITNVSQDENGSYTCQSKKRCKIAKDSIHILCADKEMRSKNMGSPASYLGKQNNKVGPITTSKQINERRQPIPPMGGVVEDKLKRRPQPQPPENIYAEDLNLQELPPNYEDAQGLPTVTPPSNRLTPLTAKQATVQEKDSSKGTKKKRKKKKKKDQMNVEKQEEGMEESRGTLAEDEAED